MRRTELLPGLQRETAGRGVGPHHTQAPQGQHAGGRQELLRRPRKGLPALKDARPDPEPRDLLVHDVEEVECGDVLAHHGGPRRAIGADAGPKNEERGQADVEDVAR